MMNKTVWLLATVLIFGLCPAFLVGQTKSADVPSAAASAAAPNSDPSQNPTFSERYPRYVIAQADTFDLVFDLSPEFNQTLTVQPDGFVTLRGAGDLHVEGMTVPQMTEAIRKAYSKILSDPLISVVLKDFQHAYFVADGEVKTPGKYELRGDVTLTEGVAMAGGFLESAKHSQVLLFRRVSNDWTQAQVINVKKMLSQGNLHEDLHLRPGDMLYVPKNRVSKIMPFLPTRTVTAYARQF